MLDVYANEYDSDETCRRPLIDVAHKEDLDCASRAVARALVVVALCCPSAPDPWIAEAAHSLQGWDHL